MYNKQIKPLRRNRHGKIIGKAAEADLMIKITQKCTCICMLSKRNVAAH